MHQMVYILMYILIFYLLRTEITKSHLNNHICQHRGMKTSTVTPSFYYVFNISLYCNDTISSFIGNLRWVLLLRNHLNVQLQEHHSHFEANNLQQLVKTAWQSGEYPQTQCDPIEKSGLCPCAPVYHLIRDNSLLCGLTNCTLDVKHFQDLTFFAERA